VVRKPPIGDPPGTRFCYVCFRLTREQYIELARMGGASPLDMHSSDVGPEVKRMLRVLVDEAWGARQRKRARRSTRAAPS